MIEQGLHEVLHRPLLRTGVAVVQDPLSGRLAETRQPQRLINASIARYRCSQR